MVLPILIRFNEPDPYEPRIYQISSTCSIYAWQHAHYMETVFSDGLVTPALFSFDAADKALAASLGYGENPLAMHREHDVAHTFLAIQLGWDYSPVLRGVATRQHVSPAQRIEEEHRVLMFQKYLNTRDVDPALSVFPRSSLPQLRESFRKMITLIWE